MHVPMIVPRQRGRCLKLDLSFSTFWRRNLTAASSRQAAAMEVTDTPQGKVPTAGSTEVARSADSAKRQDLNFITKNNQIDAEYQLPIAADAKGTWVRCLCVRLAADLPRLPAHCISRDGSQYLGRVSSLALANLAFGRPPVA